MGMLYNITTIPDAPQVPHCSALPRSLYSGLAYLIRTESPMLQELLPTSGTARAIIWNL
jgi:hypothetical protein